VVKNPLSPVEHPGGIGVNNELFEASLELFVVTAPHTTAFEKKSLMFCRRMYSTSLSSHDLL